MDYQIGICEDDTFFIDTLKAAIQNYGQLKSLSIQITTYLSGDALLADYHTRHFNLLILDVEMPGPNGIEVAAQIRHFDEDVVIIYSTIHENFSLQAFDVEAMSYLVKPFTNEKLFTKLNLAFKSIAIKTAFKDFKNTYISVKSKQQTNNLSYDEILYISKRRNSLTIHTTTKEYLIYMSIRDFRNQLDSLVFVKINPGQIINWSKVTYFDGNLIYIKDVELTVSRQYASKLNNRYRQEATDLLRRKVDEGT